MAAALAESLPPILHRPPVATPVVLVSTGTNQDKVVRRRMPLSAIDREDAKLRFFHGYWDAKRAGRRAPARKEIDIIDLRALLGLLHVIDSSSGDPTQFTFRLWGTDGRIQGQANLNNRPIAAFPSPTLRQTLFEDYGEVVETWTPIYHNVVAQLDYVRFSYSRLIVPLSDDGASVTTLMVAVNRRAFSDLALEAW